MRPKQEDELHTDHIRVFHRNSMREAGKGDTDTVTLLSQSRVREREKNPTQLKYNKCLLCVDFGEDVFVM